MKVIHNIALGRDISVQGLKEEGAKIVLVATGLPEPMRDECFKVI